MVPTINIHKHSKLHFLQILEIKKLLCFWFVLMLLIKWLSN